MINRLSTRNFTVLRKADVAFSQNLNVIVGENGTGKTHLIKLLYSVLSAYSMARSSTRPLKQVLAEKLLRVFMPDRLGRLATRTQGRARTTVDVHFDDKASDISFSFATNNRDVRIGKSGAFASDRPVYFPAKELLSIFPNFASLYSEYHLPYDETYFDTINLLGLPYAKGPRDSDPQNEVIGLIEDAIGGRIRLDPTGKAFHLLMKGETERKGNMEIDLVAEGWRKLGMLTQVVLNKALRDKGYLFWDEPEANLNPKLIHVVARAIFKIATESKIQVFVTTHSLFLLRELELLSMQSGKERQVRYIGIRASGEIDQGDSSVALKTVSALDAEVAQADRILCVGRPA